MLTVKTTRKVFVSLLLLGGVFLSLSSFALADTIIPGSIDTSLQVIQRLLITDDGSPLGAPIADFNTGGDVIFTPVIKDVHGHKYLTGEVDPVFAASIAAGISALQITHWDEAYSRGNHALV